MSTTITGDTRRARRGVGIAYAHAQAPVPRVSADRGVTIRWATCAQCGQIVGETLTKSSEAPRRAATAPDGILSSADPVPTTQNQSSLVLLCECLPRYPAHPVQTIATTAADIFLTGELTE